LGFADEPGEANLPPGLDAGLARARRLARDQNV
jgi:hypothetical protein